MPRKPEPFIFVAHFEPAQDLGKRLLRGLGFVVLDGQLERIEPEPQATEERQGPAMTAPPCPSPPHRSQPRRAPGVTESTRKEETRCPS